MEPADRRDQGSHDSAEDIGGSRARARGIVQVRADGEIEQAVAVQILAAGDGPAKVVTRRLPEMHLQQRPTRAGEHEARAQIRSPDVGERSADRDVAESVTIAITDGGERFTKLVPRTEAVDA